MQPSPPADPPDAALPPPDADERSLWVPVILVAIALLSALAGPLTIRLLEQRMDRAMQTVIMPARDLVVARRIETQRGIAANAGYLAELQPRDPARWTQLRQLLDARCTIRRRGLRFRRDPKAYLGTLEERLSKLVLPP